MNKTFKTLALVTALAGAAVVAIAQPMGGHEDMMGQEHHGRMDPAKMEAMMNRRADELKARLKLTPEGSRRAIERRTRHRHHRNIPFERRGHRDQRAAAFA